MVYFKVYKKHKAETEFFGFDYYDDCGISYVPSKKKPLFQTLKKKLSKKK
jgi:hypothetical protein